MHKIEDVGEEDTPDDLRVTPRRRSGSAPASKSRPIIPATSSATYPLPEYSNTDDMFNKFTDLTPSNSPPPFVPAYLHNRELSRDRESEEQAPQSMAPQSTSCDRRGEFHDHPATPRSRDGSDAIPEFGDTARISERSSHSLGGAHDSSDREASGSFVGMLSPFADDPSPFEPESPLPPSPDSATQKDSLDQSQSQGRPLHMTKSGRVPIKDVRQELAAAAPASIRNLPRKSTVASDESKPTLQQMLTDSKQDWLILESDLEIAVDSQGKPIKLGSGAFGTVYKGVYDQSTEVAIKSLKYETQKDMEEALFEVAILKKQLHPNVLQFLGASIGDGTIQLVTELMAGNLYKALQHGRCTWYYGGKNVAINIASALSFMHKKGVVHLDVKSANILLTSNNVAKLGDLGLSAMVNTESFVQTLKGLGTLQWAAPEVLLGTHPVTSATDVYSFGTVLWEICTGEVPHRPLRRINTLPGEPDEAPPEVGNLIYRCLATVPYERPKMQEVYQKLKDL